MIPSGPGNLLLVIWRLFPAVPSSRASTRDKSPVKGGSEVQNSLSRGGHRHKTRPVFSRCGFPFSERSFCTWVAKGPMGGQAIFQLLRVEQTWF